MKGLIHLLGLFRTVTTIFTAMLCRSLAFETPLHRAAEKGSKEVVELLLKHEAEINPTGDAYTVSCYVVQVSKRTSVSFHGNNYVPFS